MRKKCRLSLLIVLGILMGSSIFAQSKPGKPQKDEVVIVCRVSLEPSIDFAFFRKAYEESKVGFKKASESVSVRMWYYAGASRMQKSRKDSVDQGQFGKINAAVVSIPPDRTIFLESAEIRLFGIDDLYFHLPLNAKIQIPEGAQYIYIGSLEYVVRNEFLEIDTVRIRDEFDAASDFVRTNYDKTARLVRVNLTAMDGE